MIMIMIIILRPINLDSRLHYSLVLMIGKVSHLIQCIAINVNIVWWRRGIQSSHRRVTLMTASCYFYVVASDDLLDDCIIFVYIDVHFQRKKNRINKDG